MVGRGSGGRARMRRAAMCVKAQQPRCSVVGVNLVSESLCSCMRSYAAILAGNLSRDRARTMSEYRIKTMQLEGVRASDL